MLTYTVDDAITNPLTTSVEITLELDGQQRWLFFVTPELLANVGDYVEGTEVRIHLGARHMIIVSELSLPVIDSVLQQLYASGELASRSLPLDSRGVDQP